jgi:hypothetical protein
MFQKKALERWDTKLANYKVTPRAICPIAKSLTKMCGPKAPSAILSSLGPIFYLTSKANLIADCLENRFRVHDLCECHHRRHVEAQVKALLATVDEDIHLNF